DVDVLVHSAGVDRFTEVVRLALRDQRNSVDGRPVGGILARFAEHARAAIAENIGARDQAGAEPVMALAEIVELAGSLEKLTEEINAGIEGGRWNVDDVAARFVSVGWVIGVPERPEIMGFNADRLLVVLPSAREHAAALPPDDASGAIDEYDVSWPNRRRLARQSLRSFIETAEAP
ncbi:hypothetical protein, partial [Nocardia sp. NPDC003354]